MSDPREHVRGLAPSGGSDDQGLVLQSGVWTPTDVVLGLTSDDGSVVIVDNGDGTLDLAATGGGGGVATLVGCKATRTAVQTLTTNVNTAVSFTATDVYDTNSIHNPASNPSRLTIPGGMAGAWRIAYSTEFASNATGLRSTFLSVNGTAVVPDGSLRVGAVGGSESTRLSASTDLLLSAADYVEVFVRQTSGGNLDLSTAVMSCQYLGAP